MEQETTNFRIMKNGYDRFAVDDVMQRNIQEIQSLKTQLEMTSRQIKMANEQLDLIRQRYQSLVSELSIKEKAADDISRLALKEANTIIETAQNNADSIVREALTTARMILVDLSRITNEASVAKTDMKKQLLDLLVSLEHFVLPSIPKSEWVKQEK